MAATFYVNSNRNIKLYLTSRGSFELKYNGYIYYINSIENNCLTISCLENNTSLSIPNSFNTDIVIGDFMRGRYTVTEFGRFRPKHFCDYIVKLIDLDYLNIVKYECIEVARRYNLISLYLVSGTHTDVLYNAASMTKKQIALLKVELKRIFGGVIQLIPLMPFFSSREEIPKAFESRKITLYQRGW